MPSVAARYAKLLFLFGAALLGLGYLNHFSNTADTIAVFRLHFLILVLILALIFAFLRLWIWCASGLFLCLIGLLSLAPFLTVASNESSKIYPIKILQFNVNFRNPKPGDAIEWLRQENPDVLFLQEISSATLPIFEELKSRMPHSVLCRFRSVGSVAILSRFPAVSSSCREGSGLASLRVRMENKLVTLVVVHLHWPFPFEQAIQVDELVPLIRDLPKPVIVGGDFNATPWSSAVERIAHAAQARNVSGVRFTLRKGWQHGYLALPIDHILIPDEFSLGEVAVERDLHSDHLPLRVQVSLSNPL